MSAGEPTLDEVLERLKAMTVIDNGYRGIAEMLAYGLEAASFVLLNVDHDSAYKVMEIVAEYRSTVGTTWKPME